MLTPHSALPPPLCLVSTKPDLSVCCLSRCGTGERNAAPSCSTSPDSWSTPLLPVCVKTCSLETPLPSHKARANYSFCPPHGEGVCLPFLRGSPWKVVYVQVPLVLSLGQQGKSHSPSWRILHPPLRNANKCVIFKILLTFLLVNHSWASIS